MSQRKAGIVAKEISRWYFLGFFIWIAIIFFLICYAGGCDNISPEFTFAIMFLFGSIGIGALILYSVQVLRKTNNQ
ncbi:MAG: hypothetical protein ACFFCF_05890 [Promethearchaeota archaeon]